jgi:hypothetical protein
LTEAQRKSNKWKTKALRYREKLLEHGIDIKNWTEEAANDIPVKVDPVSKRSATVRYWYYDRHYFFPTDM